jgi:hypothetical protein
VSETEPEIEFVTRVLTCHTEGCGNDGHPISLDVPADVEAYSCGACGQPISDVS